MILIYFGLKTFVCVCVYTSSPADQRIFFKPSIAFKVWGIGVVGAMGSGLAIRERFKKYALNCFNNDFINFPSIWSKKYRNNFVVFRFQKAIGDHVEKNLVVVVVDVVIFK
jgi:hypothetical protein